MSLEERAAYLQNLKEQACLDPVDARARLLSELTDTVSMLCHRIYSIDSVVNGLNETLDEVQELLSYDFDVEETDESAIQMGVDEYYDDSNNSLYAVKCPQCGEKFAEDEHSLRNGFSCPGCGEKLIQED